MLVLYLDTTTGRWYDDNGIELDSSSPKFAFQSRDTLKICTVTATPDSKPLDNDPATWTRDYQWAGKLAKITVDNDYIHRIKGTITTSISGHVTKITTTIPSAKESMIPATGNLRMLLSDSQYEVVPYTARTILDNGTCEFDVDADLEHDYVDGSYVDCPQSPYLIAEMDVEASNPGAGEFQFDILADSLRLREEMLYTNTPTLSTQGMELLFYRSTENGNEPVRAYLCKTFAIVGTLGDVGDMTILPESQVVDRTHQIIASIIAAGFDVQLSVNGEIWVDYSVGSIPRDILFWRFRFEQVTGNWSPAIPLLVGPEGKSAYEIAVAQGFEGDVDEWLESLVGSGKSAYEVAVEHGFDGDVDEWLASLVGPTGEGLAYDVSGKGIADRALYDDQKAGFKFAFADTDNSSRSSSVHIYTKLSDKYADWSDALTVEVFGGLEPVITSVAPIQFSPPPSNDGVYYFVIDVATNPDAIVSQVTIDTDSGELVLPYYSDLGVRKILKRDNKLYIYLGDSVQKYTRGRVYLTQMIAAEKTSGGDTPEDAGGSMYYGYIEDAGLQSVTGITDAMLSVNTITSTNSASVGSVSLGDVPAGSFTVALVPASSNLKVYKDNGFGGKVNFEVDNGISGSGANGSKVLIGGVEYLVYGEFNLVDGITTIYID